MARVATITRPSDSTLDSVPTRALTFLIAIAERPPIGAMLHEAGFTVDDHEEGWRLLKTVGTFKPGILTAPSHSAAKAAGDEICTWVATHFRRYEAALLRLHPAWTDLFPETDPRYPAACLLAVATLTEQLRHGEASRDATLQRTLAQRGLTHDELTYLTALVTTAQSATTVTTGDEERDAHTDERIALYHWYRDWAESAKRFVKRRDYRVALGISGKREE
jgi:hypothetical protein